MASPQNNLLMGFIGDDFTGSTDAMESLARHGIRTVLFTDIPTPQQLQKYEGLRAFGIASLTRSLPTDQIAAHIKPAFEAMRRSGVPIVHYKTCSTFDSSPNIGSIGRVIDVGMDVFKSRFVPVIVGAPALGRYCVFGNLFARCGSDTEIYRIDRHPSMSRHPITPMDEGDLRRHLGKQTTKRIGLVDVLSLELSIGALNAWVISEIGMGSQILMFDVLRESHLEPIGSVLATLAATERPLFVAGSSGVESALCSCWIMTRAADQAARFAPLGPSKPMIAACGSCSPVTGSQIKWAVEHGFVEVIVDGQETNPARHAICDAIRHRKSVCIHTRGTQSPIPESIDGPHFGPILGKLLLDVLSETPVRRVLVAGGDTSSHIARALNIEAVEMIAELTRGSPLCRASSPNSAVNNLEITFKGGQIGPEDFFGLVQNGRPESN
jgi:uncharacterized protein YgbK (DUF1537 family)